MRIEELVGSPQTYEYTFPQPNKNKSIALKTFREEYDKSSDEYTMRDKEIAFCARKFRKLLASRKVRIKKRTRKFWGNSIENIVND